MEKQEMLEMGKAIVVDGFANQADEDMIKLALCQAGVPFGRANAIFNEIAIGEGLMVDPKKLADELKAQVEGSQWDSLTEWSQVESCIEGIQSEMADGNMEVKRGKVLAAVKAYCKENEIKLPKQTAATKAGHGSKGSKISVATVDMFIAKPQSTREDFYNVVRPLVKAHKNAVDYVSRDYVTMYACSNGISVKTALEQTKDFKIPVDPEATVEAAE